jgi:hypothetical protein
MAKEKHADIFWRVFLAPAVFGYPLFWVTTFHRGITAAFWVSVIGTAAVICAIGTWRRYERAVSVSVGMIFVVLLHMAWSLFR